MECTFSSCLVPPGHGPLYIWRLSLIEPLQLLQDWNELPSGGLCIIPRTKNTNTTQFRFPRDDFLGIRLAPDIRPDACSMQAVHLPNKFSTSNRPAHRSLIVDMYQIDDG